MNESTFETQYFALPDPRDMDGDPYEVAQRSCLQAEALARMLAITLEATSLMARNAQMERNMVETPHDPRAGEWEDSAQGTQFARCHKNAKNIERTMNTLAKASGYNPKKPPKE